MFGFHTRQWNLDQQDVMKENHEHEVRSLKNQIGVYMMERDVSVAEARSLRERLDNQKLYNRRIALQHAVDVTPWSNPEGVLKAAGLFDTYLERGSTLPTYAPDGKLTQRAVVTISWGSLKYRLERLILDGMNRAPSDLTEDILEILKNDAEVEVIDIDEAPKVQPRPIRDNPQA